MNFETIGYELNDSIGTLKINRPKALNALNAQVIEELTACVRELRGDKDLRCLIIMGAGDKAFVAGADIKEMSQREADTGEAMAFAGQQAFQLIEEFHCPVIAAVNGFALGGGLELALACDFIIASKKAKVGLPEVSLGLIPGYGGTQRLARHIGKANARLMTLSGDIFEAEQAEKWGLIALTVEPDALMTEVNKLAKTISTRSPVALNLAKRSINEGFDVTQDEGMKIEAKLFGEVFKSKDKIEGVAAFMEKRSPNFTGA